MKIEECIDLISREYGNAFYILDTDVFEQNFKAFLSSFKHDYQNFNIAYSYKTNYIPAIVKLVNSLGGYAEIVSSFEGEIALKSGVPYEKIIWNGPFKEYNEVLKFLNNGSIVNIDNLTEINLIANHFNRTHKTINLGLRCNFNIDDGVVSRFGIDINSKDFQNALDLFKENKNIRLKCLHCHFAKRSIKYWPNRVENIIKIAKMVNRILGYYPDFIDLGGGIYGFVEDSLKQQFSDAIPSYNDYAKIVTCGFKQAFPNENIKILLEPGTALVGNCMRFVSRVENIKKIGNKMFVTVLGSQKNINMANINPPIKVINKAENKINIKDGDIVGYTCIENDVLYRGFNGSLGYGDFIVFSNCGSYSIVMKPPFILPNFPVLDISKNDIKLIKRKETFADLMQSYFFDV